MLRAATRSLSPLRFALAQGSLRSVHGSVQVPSWLEGRGYSGFGFLPFPPGVVAYSEAQLYTPFRKRARADPLGEANTHVDGIVGQFTIAGSKSGITLEPGCRYLAVFEAKMYSGLSRGVANVRDYDQVSRTAACMIHGMLEADAASDCAAHLVVLYPADNERIVPEQYTEGYLHAQIAGRVEGYRTVEGYGAPETRFFRAWEDALPRIEVAFVTWEDAVEGIGDAELGAFYGLCRRFNGAPT